MQLLPSVLSSLILFKYLPGFVLQFPFHEFNSPKTIFDYSLGQPQSNTESTDDMEEGVKYGKSGGERARSLSPGFPVLHPAMIVRFSIFVFLIQVKYHDMFQKNEYR
jgi:hypothetical protein